MKVSGFTLVRNGVQFDYPFLESLRSLLPLVDELVINVGIGDDGTVDLVERFCAEEGGGKAIFFESRWPLDVPEKKRGGLILSEQTNLALDRCTGDWCIYLQADEVLHEDDASLLREALKEAHSRPAVQGLLFEYVHFYGSYDVIQRSRGAYRREVRALRRSSGARSVGDAQSFRGRAGEKLTVIRSGARVFHYGWVRPPEAMKQKTFFMDTLYHGAPSREQSESGTPYTGENYKYKRIYGLFEWTGSHPVVMREKIAKKGWHWDVSKSPLIWNWKDITKVALDLFERATGRRLFEYRSYRLIR